MKKIILIIFLVLITAFVGGEVWYFNGLIKKNRDDILSLRADIKKEVSELEVVQSNQNKYIEYLFTYDWNMYSKKDIVYFRYPRFMTLCETSKKENEIVNVKMLWERNLNCKEFEQKSDNFIWPLEFKIINNNDAKFKSLEDVLKYEKLEGAENITTFDSKTKYARMGGDFLTEWYDEKKNALYAIVVFYPPNLKEKYNSPITVIKIPNQPEVKYPQLTTQYSFMNTFHIMKLILDSIQFP